MFFPAGVELRRKGWAQRVTLETAQREARPIPHAVREMVLTVPPVIVLRERALLLLNFEYRARSWKALRAVPAERVR